MRFFGKGIKTKAACFLAALAVMAAGFLLKEHLRDRSDRLRQEAYEHLTVAESAECMEKLSAALSELAERGGGNGLLSEIRLNSALAISALGHISLDGGAGELFSYLSTVSEVSRLALELGLSEMGETSIEKAPSLALFSLLGHYAERINNEALPQLGTDNSEFENALNNIFSDTALETILYESGFGELAAGNAFQSIGGGMIDERTALRTAREHLGKNAYLKINLSKGEIPIYHVGGKNVSAVISAKSGFVMQFMFDLPEGEMRISESAAKENADSFLGNMDLNITETELVSTENKSGLYIFEYAPVQNDILCLDERILVGVSQGSGRICLFDAVDHYRYYTKGLKAPQDIISSDSIMEKYGLSEPPRLCKLERREGIESLCYRIDGENNRFFISALSGARIEDR